MGAPPPNNKNVEAGLYNIYRPLALWCWVVPPPPSIITFFLRLNVKCLVTRMDKDARLW